MDRRNFLIKSASVAAGFLFGVNSFSRAFAFQGPTEGTFPGPRIALIIDDIGNSRYRAHQFLKLGIPITFSILPRLSYSDSVAVEINDEGHEVMLHQPMEPYNSHLDPGPGALYVGDEAATIGATIESNISDVPYAIGVNNHMGSRFTECQSEITNALRVIKKKNLFFIDSLTSNHSKAYAAAKKLRMTATRRNIFLDNSRDESAILCQLHKLTSFARKYGDAIGIGHPSRETAKAIGDFLKNYRNSDISFVHVSEILYS